MKNCIIIISFFYLTTIFSQEEKKRFDYMDIFEIQYASEPMISPSGKLIVYRRMVFDKIEDESTGNLWIINSNAT